MTPRIGTTDGWRKSGWPSALWLSLALLALRVAISGPADVAGSPPWTATAAESAFGRFVANLDESNHRQALIEAAASRADARPGQDDGPGLPVASTPRRPAPAPFHAAPSPRTDGRAGQDSHSAFRARAPPASV